MSSFIYASALVAGTIGANKEMTSLRPIASVLSGDASICSSTSSTFDESDNF